MFDALENPRFVIREAVAEGDRCVLTWDFLLAIRGRAITIHGASLLEFAPDGRIARHRDYWDAAEELYEKLPVLGGLMRWVKRRLTVPQA
jgi:ketosteroid isomerase-like protein